MISHAYKSRPLAIVIGGLASLAPPLVFGQTEPELHGWRSGDPFLMSIGIIGSIFLLTAFLFALAKRSGARGRRFLHLHIVLSLVGFVLVAVHTKGNLLRPPALLLGVLVGLMVLGFWARTRGAHAMAATFGVKRGAFAPTDPTLRAKIEFQIRTKERLLERIDDNAREATFSPTLQHWLQHPRLSFAYRRAVAKERSLVQMHRGVPLAQAYWRRIHQVLAVAFILGLAVHVGLALFFADYVADGDAVYWWHFSAVAQ